MDKQVYERELANARSQGNKRAEANALGILGDLYEQSGDYRKALDYFKQSMQICVTIKEWSGAASSAWHVGSVYETWFEDPSSAIEYFEKAYQYAQGPEKEKYRRILMMRQLGRR